MNKCEELERLLQSLYLDLDAGGYRPSLRALAQIT